MARLGGDEFVVLLAAADPDEVAQRCREVLEVLAEPMQLGEDLVSVTASVGLGSARGVPPELALARADAAMYAAKQSGRGGVQDYAEPTTAGRSRSQVADVVHALEEQTRTDPLTGLLNVRALREALQQAQGQADRSGHPFSVVFLDIDHFGAHGDTAGDHALIAVGRQLTATCRAGDQVYRKGGEELVALLPATNADEALAAADRLRAGIEDLGMPHDGAPAPGVLTITAGVATSQTNEPAQAVLDRAGRATTTSKNTGQRNSILASS